MRAPFSLRHTIRTAAPALALGVAGLTVACADGPTAPGAAPAAGAASLGKTAPSTTGTTTTTTTTSTSASSSYTVSQTAAADTTVTVFVVGTNASTAASFVIGHESKIDFPLAAGSICNPATSGYGPAEWDRPCAALTAAVRITAKTWINAAGKVATDFQPALRFVPGQRKPVLLTLKDAALAGTRVDFCTPTACVDEAAADKSLATVLDPKTGKVSRAVKHFSGYVVVANRGGSDEGY
jgi:hypothetical protein